MTRSSTPTEAAATDSLEATAEALEQWGRRFQILADPTRARLLVALHSAPGVTVNELATAVGQAPNAVTKALQTMARAGFVEGTKDGRHKRWRIVDAEVHDLVHRVGSLHTPLHPHHDH